MSDKSGSDEQVKRYAQEIDRLRARIAELERALKSVAAYVKDGECYCLNGEENLGRNPCGWCVAEREIKSVLGEKEAKP